METFQCPECGFEWEAIPPAVCPECRKLYKIEHDIPITRKYMAKPRHPIVAALLEMKGGDSIVISKLHRHLVNSGAKYHKIRIVVRSIDSNKLRVWKRIQQ